MEAIQGAAESVARDVRTIRKGVEEIDDITDVINNIADQTNILALNASIEAARAGEAGSGFSVVADEIKALVEESQTQAGEIEAIVDSIQTDAENAVENLEEPGRGY